MSRNLPVGVQQNIQQPGSVFPFLFKDGWRERQSGKGVLPFPHPFSKLLYMPRSADWLCHREVERAALRGLWDSLRV